MIWWTWMTFASLGVLTLGILAVGLYRVSGE